MSHPGALDFLSGENAERMAKMAKEAGADGIIAPATRPERTEISPIPHRHFDEDLFAGGGLLREHSPKISINMWTGLLSGAPSTNRQIRGRQLTNSACAPSDFPYFLGK